MIHFAPITLETKPLFDKYRSPLLRNCDSAFANIFCWQQTYHSLYAETKGCLVVKYYTEGSCETAYMLFAADFSADTISRVIPMLEDDASADDRLLRITGLPACAVDIMKTLFAERYAFSASRDSADYIYSADDLRELPGRKYQSKRNHLNRFNDFYDWQYESLKPHHKDECMALESVWQQHHSNYGSTEAERLAIIRAFNNFEALGLAGGILRIGGRLAAFTYGSQVTDEVFDIHAEKADTSFEGIFPAINKLFAQNIPERFRFINREEDMGIEGLRRAKMSYHPVELEYKYTAQSLSAEDMSIRELWAEAFGDDADFIDKFLAEKSSYRIRTFSVAKEGKTVSMLHIVPLADTEGHRFAYIYGVATAVGYRNTGLATSLLKQATEAVRHCFDAAILIPSDDNAKTLYEKVGFGDCGTGVMFETGFDFGTGDCTKDKAMVLKFGELNLPDTISLHSYPFIYEQ